MSAEISENVVLGGAGISLVGFLFKYYFGRVAKSLETLSKVHTDLEELKTTMEKMTSFREEFLMMKKSIESAVMEIQNLRALDNTVSKLRDSQAKAWEKIDSHKAYINELSHRTREREHFFQGRLHVVKGLLEQLIQGQDPAVAKRLEFQFQDPDWRLPVISASSRKDLE